MDSFELKNLKYFLTLYNKISESCFIHCVNQLGERDLSQDEARCVDICTRKYTKVNHKMFQVFMEVQPQLVNKRLEEMNKQQAALADEMKTNEKGGDGVVQDLNKRETAGGTKAEINDSNKNVSAS